MKRLDTILKTLVLAGLGAMLLLKITSGTLNFYINERFAWLTFVALLLLVVFALMLGLRLWEGRSFFRLKSRRQANDAPAAGDMIAPFQPRRNGLSWSGIAIIAIPMLLGLVVPARPLGASAVGAQSMGASPSVRPGNTTTLQRAASGPKNILDWLHDFARNSDPNAYVGQSVDLIGFVYQDPRDTADEFWVSRFAITCCVADASAVGLLVKTSEAATLKNDSWVHVTGKFSVGEFAGQQMPVIIPDAVTPTDQPDNPYLYP
jgi:uncharacterized repeat protein (TIGR03943 family)